MLSCIPCPDARLLLTSFCSIPVMPACITAIIWNQTLPNRMFKQMEKKIAREFERGIVGEQGIGNTPSLA
jgi:hypothetical protein